MAIMETAKNGVLHLSPNQPARERHCRPDAIRILKFGLSAPLTRTGDRGIYRRQSRLRQGCVSKLTRSKQMSQVLLFGGIAGSAALIAGCAGYWIHDIRSKGTRSHLAPTTKNAARDLSGATVDVIQPV